jgi:hypothetical protein
LREELALKTGWPEPCSVTQDDARAILAHIDALTAERDTAVAALAQRDAQIVAWLREKARLYEGSCTAAACLALIGAIKRSEYKEAGDVADD